jgi:hypothetical protein
MRIRQAERLAAALAVSARLQAQEAYQELFDTQETVHRSCGDMQSFRPEVLRVILLDTMWSAAKKAADWERWGNCFPKRQDATHHGSFLFERSFRRDGFVRKRLDEPTRIRSMNSNATKRWLPGTKWRKDAAIRIKVRQIFP